MVALMTKENSRPKNDGPVDDVTADIQLADGKVVKELVQLFKLLADENRLQILFLLKSNKELNVRTLCSLLGQSQPSVSHHLALLRVAGLIEMRRDGKHNFYSLLPDKLSEILQLVSGANGEDALFRFQDYI